MSKTLETFYPLLVLEVPGCPLVLAKKQLVESAIDFCERSKVWLETQAAYAIAANNADYAFTTTTAGIVDSIRSANWNGVPIDPLTREWCDIYTPGWRPGVTPVITSPTPVGVTQINTTNFRLVYTPSSSGSLVLEVAYKPTRTATVLPDILYDEYEEAIVCGALARLLVMNNTPWRNPEQAAIHAARFKEAYEGANLRQSKGFGRASLRVQGQFL